MKPLFSLLTILLLSSFQALGHAEHDKARYVAPDGVDQGRCENVESPCLTIGYAASKSNKGDKILVAKGQYRLNEVDELFYLTSKLVPVYGGYSRDDHYKRAEREKNATFLLGIPTEYTQTLTDAGFTVITDSKGVDKSKSKALKARLRSFKQLANFQGETQCENGVAGNFACDNIDLVAHVPLPQLGNASAGNDVWGHVDLNTGDEYALVGVREGTAIVSLKDPANPVLVDMVPGLMASWRDIKTYQFFDLNYNRWRAYAYVATDGASDKITIIDLSDLPASVRRVGHTSSDNNVHNIYISNVNYTTGVAVNGRTPLLHSMGSNQFGGAHHSYSLADPESVSAVYSPVSATRSDYTHDGTSFVVTDSRVADNCQREGDECDIFVDFNENEMRLWDQTDQTELNELGMGIYANAKYTHSGWWTEDKKIIYVHDEGDEQTFDSNSAVIIFDVTDLNNPVYKGRWEGTTLAIDHNGFVRGNRYYMSNYERGITVLDITDPINPVEVGFFDTFPISDSNAFNGAWGVYPFLPSGLILASDINSGLYILKDNTKTTSQGQLQFETTKITAEEGETVTFTVNRINGSTGAISVDYHTLWGSAGSDDFEPLVGSLNWEPGDNSPKIITTSIKTDELAELPESFSLELFNIQGGATLYSPAAAWVTIPGIEATSAVVFANSSLSAYEGLNANDGVSTVDINIQRFPPFDQDSYASVLLASDQADNMATLAQDFEFTDTELHWVAGDMEPKTVNLLIKDDSETESEETITLQITSDDNARVGTNHTLIVSIKDDESNTAPTVTANSNLPQNYQNYVLLNAFTITDDDETLQYNWSFISGPVTVNIANADTEDATVSMSTAGDYVFKLIVTDPFDQTAEATLNITVTDTTITPTEAPKNRSGFLATDKYLLALSIALIAIRRRSRMVKQ